VRLSASEIARRARGRVVAGDPDVVVTSWGFDSRALAPGACFVALKDHRDGHDFVADAFHAGAHVALVDRHVADPLPTRGAALVQVADVVTGLQEVARSIRTERDELRVVGVTGSTGKTSTKDLLAAACSSALAHASPESFNNEFGLPLTLLNASAAVHGLIAEMGERFPGDIALLCDIARPQYGIVTNVGLAHAEHLGGPEGVAAVLAELLEALPADGVAVLPADDPWTPWLRARTQARVVTVGLSESADERVHDVVVGPDLYAEFTLAGQRVRVGLRGGHQVVNAALAAITAREAFGLDLGIVAARLAAAEGSRWRMELLESPTGVLVLNDAYNANPTSMAAGLQALTQLDVVGRRVAVLGDMRELGAHSAEAHAAIGRLAAELGTEVLIAVGSRGADIAAAARGLGPEVRLAAHADEATAIVVSLVRPGDAVLVKASRALGLQTVADRLLEAAP
jgi:UDP-N-acetylmuramoyl-tripeptide--D-alanyl-D-alanine ligase